MHSIPLTSSLQSSPPATNPPGPIICMRIFSPRTFSSLWRLHFCDIAKAKVVQQALGAAQVSGWGHEKTPLAFTSLGRRAMTLQRYTSLYVCQISDDPPAPFRFIAREHYIDKAQNLVLVYEGCVFRQASITLGQQEPFHGVG